MNIGDIVAHLKLDISDFNNGINQATGAVNNMEGTMNGGFGSVGSTLTKVGGILTASVTAPLVALGTMSAKTSMSFNKDMSAVKAITKATGTEFEDLRNLALDLGSSTSFSASEVAQAMTEMGKAGWSTSDIMNGMGGVLDAAAASGENLGLVSTVLADSITGFGLSAKDSTRVADLLTEAANAGTIGVGDLGETFKYIAPLAKTCGFSIEDVTTATTALSMSGIKGSQAGTTLRTAISSMVKPTKDVQKAMNDLGIEITNSDGSFKSLDEIVTTMRSSFDGLTEEQKAYYANVLAGREGMSGLLAILGMTQEEYDEIKTSMNECNGVARETAEVMTDNLAGAWDNMTGAMETAAIKIGDILAPAIQKVVEWITSLVNWFNNLDESQQKWIVGIAAVLAAIGPLITGIGMAISVINKIKTAITIAKAAFGLLKGAMLAMGVGAGPVLAVVAGVAAIVAAFLWLWNNCEEFRNFWINLWNHVKNIFTTFVSENKATFQALWQNIKDAWDAIVQVFGASLKIIWALFSGDMELLKSATAEWKEGMINLITACWEGIKNIFSLGCSLVKTIFTEWYNTLDSDTQAFIDKIVNALSQMWEGLKSIFEGALNIIKGIWNRDWEQVSQGGKQIWEGIKSWFSGVWDALKAVASRIGTELKNEAIKTWENIKSKASEIWNNIKTTVTNKITEMKTAAINKFNELKTQAVNKINELKTQAVNKFNELKSSCTNAISNFISSAKSKFEQLKSAITSKIESAKSQAISKMKSMASGMVSALASLPGQLRQAAINAIQGLIGGLSAKLGEVKAKAQEIASTVSGALRNALKIKSPSRVMRDEIGRYIPEGIAVGIDKNAYKAVDSVKSMADELVQPVDLSGVRTSVNSTGYSNNMYSSSSNPLLNTMKAILDKLDGNSETERQLVINIDEFNNNTEEDINSLMQRIEAQIRLNNLGKGVI